MNYNISNIYDRLQKHTNAHIAYGNIHKNENRVFVQAIESFNTVPLEMAIDCGVPVGYCLFFNALMDAKQIQFAEHHDIQPILVMNNYPDTRFKKEDFYIFGENHKNCLKIGYSLYCNKQYNGIDIKHIDVPSLSVQEIDKLKNRIPKYDILIVSEDINLSETTQSVLQQQFPQKHIDLLSNYNTLTELGHKLCEYKIAIIYNDFIASFASSLINKITLTNRPTYEHIHVVKQFQDIINVIHNEERYVNNISSESITSQNFDRSLSYYFNTLADSLL